MAGSVQWAIDGDGDSTVVVDVAPVGVMIGKLPPGAALTWRITLSIQHEALCRLFTEGPPP